MIINEICLIFWYFSSNDTLQIKEMEANVLTLHFALFQTFFSPKKVAIIIFQPFEHKASSWEIGIYENCLIFWWIHQMIPHKIEKICWNAISGLIFISPIKVCIHACENYILRLPHLYLQNATLPLLMCCSSVCLGWKYLILKNLKKKKIILLHTLVQSRKYSALCAI